MSRQQIKAVIFDWAGTTVDHGCFAPIYAMQNAFSKHGLDVTLDEIRKPMGMLKIDHIRAVLHMKRVLNNFKEKNNREPTEDDIELVYKDFEKGIFAVLNKHAKLIKGVKETVETLRDKHIRIGSTTGYTREMLDVVAASASEQGYEPDYSITSDEVEHGRPEPDMIRENMRALKIKDPRTLVKVGDTIVDIQEGKNAGCWSVGVVVGSSMMGVNQKELESIKPEQLEERIDVIKQEMLLAGADFVIDRITDLPELVQSINQELTATPS